jgi:hypothetical protein
MPVVGYLTEDEAADVYLYLTLNPPQASAAVIAAITNNEPLPLSGPIYSSHMPVAGSQGDYRQISLVRFAIFPAALFLLLGGVVVKCLPLAVKDPERSRESLQETGLVEEEPMLRCKTIDRRWLRTKAPRTPM